jgi:hypothetical protein
MSLLLTDINTAITVLGISTNTITLGISSSNPNKVSITLSTSATLVINTTGLSQYILGISGQSVTGTILNATNNFLLNVDNYINIYFSNIPSTSHNNSGSVMASYKLPLNCTSNVVYYNADNQSFSQYIEITDSNYVLTNINVKLLDRWGNIIPSQGLDYSFTLAIEYF